MSLNAWVEDPELPGMYATASGVGFDLIEGVHFTREGAKFNLIRLPRPSDYDSRPNG